jgi:phosphopantothenoylcysteine decarboxylase/phosphopantothenate--cysteine ligase
MALTCPVLICPSMNVNMFRNPLLKGNLARLKEVGYHVMEPETGWLACGWEGEGRMPEPETIADEIERLLAPKDLQGEKILVTSGPTEEPLDPVRFITNRSSGRMGAAVARRAAVRGADVTLVAGPLKVTPPAGVNHIPIRTAQEMFDRVMEFAGRSTVVIKAAAVADFRPARESEIKIKKEQVGSSVELVKTIDILHSLGESKDERQILIGFAAETTDTLENGRKKLKAKNLDMLVLNDVTQPGAGFDHDTNIVRFIHRSGLEEQMDILSKDRVADLILDRVKHIREGAFAGPCC